MLGVQFQANRLHCNMSCIEASVFGAAYTVVLGLFWCCQLEEHLACRNLQHSQNKWPFWGYGLTQRCSGNRVGLAKKITSSLLHCCSLGCRASWRYFGMWMLMVIGVNDNNWAGMCMCIPACNLMVYLRCQYFFLNVLFFTMLYKLLRCY